MNWEIKEKGKRIEKFLDRIKTASFQDGISPYQAEYRYPFKNFVLMKLGSREDNIVILWMMEDWKCEIFKCIDFPLYYHRFSIHSCCYGENKYKTNWTVASSDILSSPCIVCSSSSVCIELLFLLGFPSLSSFYVGITVTISSTAMGAGYSFPQQWIKHSTWYSSPFWISWCVK